MLTKCICFTSKEVWALEQRCQRYVCQSYTFKYYSLRRTEGLISRQLWRKALCFVPDTFHIYSNVLGFLSTERKMLLFSAAQGSKLVELWRLGVIHPCLNVQNCANTLLHTALAFNVSLDSCVQSSTRDVCCKILGIQVSEKDKKPQGWLPFYDC